MYTWQPRAYIKDGKIEVHSGEEEGRELFQSELSWLSGQGYLIT
jgi:hypothetical protein